MAKHGKRYLALREKVDRRRRYSVEEALRLVKELANARFDETVDVAIKLGIDPRKTDQRVRSSVVLPHGTGKVPKVAVVASGEKAIEAREAGADEVGGEDLIERIEKGWEDFDILLATPDMMPLLGRRLGRKLGPRMPSSRAGTVTMDLASTIRELKLGRIEFRNDNTGVVHAPIGKSSFTEEQLKENFATLLAAVLRNRPPTVRGAFVRSIAISSTMGPGLKIDVQDAINVASLT